LNAIDDDAALMRIQFDQAFRQVDSSSGWRLRARAPASDA
jgi:hypothetical protein